MEVFAFHQRMACVEKNEEYFCNHTGVVKGYCSVAAPYMDILPKELIKKN